MGMLVIGVWLGFGPEASARNVNPGHGHPERVHFRQDGRASSHFKSLLLWLPLVRNLHIQSTSSMRVPASLTTAFCSRVAASRFLPRATRRH